uniref:Uncharacterized protein n=1 Tax=Oryza glumipatula TaxID=40148 RepID=A0A0D9ZF08_9ORYZ
MASQAFPSCCPVAANVVAGAHRIPPPELLHRPPLERMVVLAGDEHHPMLPLPSIVGEKVKNSGARSSPFDAARRLHYQCRPEHGHRACHTTPLTNVAGGARIRPSAMAALPSAAAVVAPAPADDAAAACAAWRR